MTDRPNHAPHDSAPVYSPVTGQAWKAAGCDTTPV